MLKIAPRVPPPTVKGYLQMMIRVDTALLLRTARDQYVYR
jgi:hypothetical protein